MDRLTATIAFVRRWFVRVSAALVGLAILGGIYMAYRLNIDRAEWFEDDVAHFKYGSTGGDRNFGVPVVVWQALPVLFRDHLPAGRENLGWEALGFIYETDEDGNKRDRPVGSSLRNYMGIERIFLNCAACHTGTLRTSPDADPVVLVGMPANRIDLQAFQNFLTGAALDERFTSEHILAQIDAMGLELDLINRLALQFFGVYELRERILTISSRFSFAEREPAFGPGRFDTFSPAKALLAWPTDQIPDHEAIGVVDFPSIWLQGPRDGMQLHWDGNNTKLQERNRSAAFGTGALPPILDRESVAKVENYLLTAQPPAFSDFYPDQLDPTLAAAGKPLYEALCLDCHGLNGRDFDGKYVGQVAPIEEIGTDRHRLDNYTFDLAVNQNVLYAEFGEERFQNFRKTNGYANMPLDGVWLRAPYLHNGSVPTLWDLLTPADQRPAVFYRGYDVYDPVNVGFESRSSEIPAEERDGLFCFETRAVTFDGCPSPPANRAVCDATTCRGNSNSGHEYGTDLADGEKRALIEYLKTF